MSPASFRVAEQAGGAASAPAFSPGAHPARPAASAWPSITLGQATTPPADLRAYGTSLGRAIEWNDLWTHGHRAGAGRFVR